MARANMEKSKDFSTSTTTARIKVLTQEAQNLHQLKLSFLTQIYLINVPLNLNIVKKIYFLKNSFWNFYEVRSERGA